MPCDRMTFFAPGDRPVGGAIVCGGRRGRAKKAKSCVGCQGPSSLECNGWCDSEGFHWVTSTGGLSTEWAADSVREPKATLHGDSAHA